MSQVRDMTSATPVIPVDAGRAIRRGLLLLVLGFGSFVLWAMLAPLDEGVPLSGQIVVDGKRKPVQHLSGGIVSGVHVRDGDLVRAGDVLLTLDIVVQSGQRAMVSSQREGLQAAIQGLQARIPQRQAQVLSLQQELAGLAPLVSEDLFPRNRYQDMQRQLADLRAQLSGSQAELAQARAQLAEADKRLSVLGTEIQRAEIRAPATGVVLASKVSSAGAVVSPGDVLMEIVPRDDALVIKARVPPHLIEQVRPGLPAQLRFSALDPRRTPVIDGRVDQVSADTITDSEGNVFYEARFSASPDEVARLGKVQLQPGMPVEAIAVTGRRTFLNYLVKPMQDHFAMALKER